METNQPKPYDQAREEALADHISNSGGRSEYMKPDFDAGFSAGYNAAMNNVAARKREDALRAEIAKDIFTRCLSHEDGDVRAFCNRELDMTAEDCVRQANALIKALRKEVKE